MARLEKILWRILSGNADQNIAFDDLIYALDRLGFEKRVKGSHHLFSRNDVVEIINLQPSDGMAKPYQVKQVRAVIVKYSLIGE